MAIENQKQIILIAIAVVFGIGAVLFTGNYITTSIQQKTQELHDQYEQQQKQMAAQMQQQSEQQMAALRSELDQVRQQQQQAIQQALSTQSAQGQGAEGLRASTFLTAKTPAGKRAVTVMVDSLNAVGGLLNAGDFVDVIAHLDVPEYAGAEKKKTVTAMVFQDLQVLAINTNLDSPGEYDKQQSTPSLKITFAVDPQEAGLLAFANKNGRLELALRASDENQKETVQASTWQTLADYVLQNQGASLDAPGEPTTDTPTENRPYIQIFRGGKEL